MSSIVKVVEVIAQSDKSFDDAAQNAVKEVAKTGEEHQVDRTSDRAISTMMIRSISTE